MFEASIRINDDLEKINQLFSTEDKTLKRGSYTINDLGGGVIEFKMNAEDIAALRAVINSITQILSVYKKVGDVVEND